MSCKKIKNILTKKELTRLKEIYKKQLPKILKNQDVALYNEDFLDAICCEYHKLILKYLKYYETPTDRSIKTKIKIAIKESLFSLQEFEKELTQPYYKYKQKDWKIFFDRAEYFFDLHKGIIKSFLSKDKYYYLDRVYLGCGFEFLLKAIFLKKGYLINKVDAIIDDKTGQIKSNFSTEQRIITKLANKGLLISTTRDQIVVRKINLKTPLKSGLLSKEFIKKNLNDFNYFVDRLKYLKPINRGNKYFDYYVLAGLKIAQSWRNNDIHTPTGRKRTNGEYQNLLKSSHDCLYKLFFPRQKIPKFECY